jgi:hypothetical protein
MAKAAEALGLDAFDESAFAEKVEIVTVSEPHEITFNMRDGREVTLGWEPRSRRESWTDEMRRAARERRLEAIRNA